MSIPSPAATLIAGGKAYLISNHGTGLLHGATLTQNFYAGGYQVDSVYGPRVSWGTDITTAETIAGFQTDYQFTMRNRTPQLTFSWNLPESVDTAENTMFIGFSPSTDQFNLVTSMDGPDPLNGLSGIGIALHEGNYKVAANEGTDATTFFDFPEPWPAVANTVYTATIAGFEENDGWTIKIGAYEDFFNNTNTQTLVVQTEVPDSITPLGGCALIMNHIVALRSLSLYRWDGFF